MKKSNFVSIPLISRDKTTRKLFVDSNAIKLLSEIQTPLGILGIAGPTRSYKSSIINLAIVEEGIFQVGDTTDSCTKGLKICTKLIKRGKVHYLVLDSEGISSFDNNSEEDIKMMTILILASSLFVYNTMKIDETTLTTLSLVATTMKRLQENNPDWKDNPLFVWILRDFNLLLTKNESGTPMNPDEYIRHILGVKQTKKRKKMMDETKEICNPQFDDIKAAVRNSFRGFHGFTFCAPSNDTSVLQNLQNVPRSKLHPTFLQTCMEFRNFIDQNMEVKTFCGKPMTGTLFLQYLQNCVQALNDGKVPVIRNQYSLMAELSCKDSIAQCFLYVKNLRPLTRYIKKNYVCQNLLQDFFPRFHTQLHEEFIKNCFEPDSLATKEAWKQVIQKCAELQKRIIISNRKHIPTIFHKQVDLKNDSIQTCLSECQTFMNQNKEQFRVFCESEPFFQFAKPLFDTQLQLVCLFTLSQWLQFCYILILEKMDQKRKELQELENENKQLKLLQDETLIKCQNIEKESNDRKLMYEEVYAKCKQVEQSHTLQILENESIQKDLFLARKEIEAQKSTIDYLTQQVTEHGNSKVEIESLKSQIQAHIIAIQDLEKSLAKKEELDAEQFDNLKKQLMESRFKITELKKSFDLECQTKEQKCKTLQDALSISQLSINELEKKEIDYKKRLAESQVKIQEQNSRYETLNSEYRTEMNEIKKLNNQMMEEKYKLLLKCQNMEHGENTLKEQNRVLRDKMDKNLELEQRLILLQQSEFQLRAMCGQKDNDINRLKSDNQDLQNKNTNLKREMQEKMVSFMSRDMQNYYSKLKHEDLNESSACTFEP